MTSFDYIRNSIKAKNYRPWVREFKLGDVAAMGAIFAQLKIDAGVKTLHDFDKVGVYEIIDSDKPGHCLVWALIAVNRQE